jgi:hypothetical protein
MKDKDGNSTLPMAVWTASGLANLRITLDDGLLTWIKNRGPLQIVQCPNFEFLGSYTRYNGLCLSATLENGDSLQV